MTLPQDITKLQSEMNAAVRAHWKAFLIRRHPARGPRARRHDRAAAGEPRRHHLPGLDVPDSGIAGLALTFWARGMPGFWWSLISAALAIGAGIVLLAKPVQGALTLTIVVGAYFLAEGVATIMYALEHRRELSERWTLDAVLRRIGHPDCRHDHHRACRARRNGRSDSWSASTCCSAALR